MLNRIRQSSDYLFALFLAIFSSVVLFAAFFFSVQQLASYWTASTAQCVECIKSFLNTFFDLEHMLLLGLLLWSMIGITRMGLYFWREREFAKQLHSAPLSKEGVYLIPDAISAAWSAGIFQHAVCANARFWSTLSTQEKKALMAHESSHLQRGDVWLFFFLGIARIVFSDPLSGRLLRSVMNHLRLRSEYDADEAAMKATSKEVLAQLLYKALLFESNAPRFAPGLEGVIHHRVEALVHGFEKPTFSFFQRTTYLMPVMIFGVGILSASMLVDPAIACLFT